MEEIYAKFITVAAAENTSKADGIVLCGGAHGRKITGHKPET